MQASGLRHWIQQHVSWPLALALCFSLLLHVFALSEVNWRHWLNTEVHSPAVLQARLLPPPALPESNGLVKAVPKLNTPKKNVARSTGHASSVVTPVSTSATDAPIATEPQAASEEDEQRLAEINAWHAMDHPDVESDEELPTPYQYVKTVFVVFVNGEERPAGSAEIEYELDTSTTYRLRWLVEGRGLLKLLYPSLEQQSTGEVGPNGLKPHWYRYAFGNRASKTYEAMFDWETNFITLKTSKGEQKLELHADTQDLLSFMYQFMFVPPLQEMHVTLTNGRRLGEYEYVFEGEDNLVIDDHTIKTVHIVHMRGDTDEKVELWLASDYRYVPVKIKKIEKNGMVIEQVATRLIAE